MLDRYIANLKEPYKRPASVNVGEVYRCAVELATNTGHTFIGVEHLLIGLGRKGNVSRLEGLGVNWDAASARLAEVMEGERVAVHESHLILTSRAKDALTLSAEEAFNQGAPEIGSEHLFSGVIKEVIKSGGSSLLPYPVDRLSALVGNEEIPPN